MLRHEAGKALAVVFRSDWKSAQVPPQSRTQAGRSPINGARCPVRLWDSCVQRPLSSAWAQDLLVKLVDPLVKMAIPLDCHFPGLGRMVASFRIPAMAREDTHRATYRHKVSDTCCSRGTSDERRRSGTHDLLKGGDATLTPCPIFQVIQLALALSAQNYFNRPPRRRLRRGGRQSFSSGI